MHANSSKSIKKGAVATNRFVATGALFVATAWFLRLFVPLGGKMNPTGIKREAKRGPRGSWKRPEVKVDEPVFVRYV